MLNKENEAILHQEPNKFNKPNVLVKVALNNTLTTNDKKIQNYLIRELLQLNQEEYKSNEIHTSISALSRHLGVTTRVKLYESLERLGSTKITFIDKFLKTRANIISSYTRPLDNLLDTLEPHNNTQDNLIIAFDTRLTQTLLQYSERYAKLDLNDINKLKITHSITLYENFIRSLGKNTIQLKNISEKELRTILNLQDKYKTTSDFSKQVIKRSVDEINKNTKIQVTLLKRVKIEGESIYKFQINQSYKWNFKKFKKCIIENFRSNSFTFKNIEYIITKRLEDNTKDLEFAISNARTFKTIETEKAKLIYETLYEMAQENINEFTHKFIIYREITNENEFNNLEFMEDKSNIEEVSNFMYLYEKTKA